MDDRKEHSLRVLGRAIRELREEHGLTVAELATAADMPAANLVALEAGRLNPRYRSLLALARGLDVEATELISRVEKIEADDSR